MAMNTEDAETLVRFVDELKLRGVKSYKGEVPLSDGATVPIEIVFDREPRRAETRHVLEER